MLSAFHANLVLFENLGSFTKWSLRDLANFPGSSCSDYYGE
jgi:hypothetical protein